jgi:hypothetical protein
MMLLSQQIINQLKDFVKLAIYITPISSFQSLDFEAWVFFWFVWEAQQQTRLTSRWQLCFEVELRGGVLAGSSPSYRWV